MANRPNLRAMNQAAFDATKANGFVIYDDEGSYQLEGIGPTNGWWRKQVFEAVVAGNDQTTQDAIAAANTAAIDAVENEIKDNVDSDFLIEYAKVTADNRWNPTALDSLKVNLVGRDQNTAPIVGTYDGSTFIVSGGGLADALPIVLPATLTVAETDTAALAALTQHETDNDHTLLHNPALQDVAIQLNTTHRQDVANFVSPAERIAWDAKADKIDSSTWDAPTGTLTINHTDSSTTVANVGVPNVLQAVAYDAPSKSFNFTFVDTTVINVPATDLFDATAYADVTPDNVLKTLTFTRLDSGTTVVDLSTWFAVRVPTPSDDSDPAKEHTWAKDDFDARLVFNGSEVDLRGTDAQPLTDRKLHIIDGTTTNLDFANTVEGSRAWTIDVSNPAEPIRDFYRSDGTNFVKTLPAETHTHEVLENIAVHVRSAGTNSGSEVDIELLIDGAWNPTDWVVSTTPITGLEAYTAHPTLHLDKAAITGPINIAHNKDGWLFFEYVGSVTDGQLTGVNYTGANGANDDGEIIVNFAGTNQHIDFADKGSVVATDLEFDQEPIAKRNAEPLDITNALTTSDVVRYTVPATGGPFVTAPPQSNVLADDAEVLLSPLAPIPADTLTDPMTVADVLLFKEVSESELASGALRRLTVTSSNLALVDETYNVDYSGFDEQLFESEIYAIGGRTLTFDSPVRDNPKKIRIHRVFINANTAEVTISFAPGSWKTLGTTEDASDIVIVNGGNLTLEFTASDDSGDNFVRVLGGWGGPSLDVASLTGGFMYLPAEDPTNHIFAMNGQTLTNGVATYPEIALKWPAWISGANLVLPDWRGRAMMATGGLGITGAAGALFNDATSQNGLNFAFYGNGSGNGGTHDTGSQGLWGGHAMSHSGPSRTNAVRRFQEDAETRPNAVGLVLCVIAGRLKVSTVNATLPTSMPITAASGNQTGNGFTANGVYRSNNTGPLQNTGFANWTWRVKATRIGDWIQHMYWNDTANIAFRESFDGGATWSAWAA